MPAKSVAQQRFFGMVHAVQKGDRPIGSVSDSIQRAAKSIKPKAVGEYAATRHADLPDAAKNPKDATQVKMGSFMGRLFLADLFIKQSDVQAALDKAEKSLQAASGARRKALEAHVGEIQQHNQKLQQENQKLQQDSQKAQQEAAASAASSDAQMQQMQAQMQAPGPVPPPAQPPYGNLAMTMAMQQQEQQGKGGGGAAGAPKPPAMPGAAAGIPSM